jgi:hypothetical protein
MPESILPRSARKTEILNSHHSECLTVYRITLSTAFAPQNYVLGLKPVFGMCSPFSTSVIYNLATTVKFMEHSMVTVNHAKIRTKC